MGKRIKGILITPHLGQKDVDYKVVTLYSPTMLEQLYEKLHTDCVEVIYRRVCDISVEIWCDEEGKLKKDPIIVGTGISQRGEFVEILVGTIFICTTTKNGASESLTDEQIETISKHLDELYEFEYEV